MIRLSHLLMTRPTNALRLARYLRSRGVVIEIPPQELEDEDAFERFTRICMGIQEAANRTGGR